MLSKVDMFKSKDKRGTFVGTAIYVPPEMINHSLGGLFSDLWSLGITIYQIIAGKVPWNISARTDEYDVFE